VTQASNQKVFKLLIVERSLISNRGHHHTQIGALKSIFPQAEVQIVAGEGYDGFLGEAVGLIPDKNFKLSKLRAKRLHGSLRQRLRISLKMLLARRRQLAASAYGQELFATCTRLAMSSNDRIIIPTADLDSLESAVDFSRRMGGAAPTVVLRFLSPTMGEHSLRFFERRLNAAVADLPPNVKLFTETEEMAAHFRSRYGLSVTGGFFLPCSVGFTDLEHRAHRDGDTFRVGVLGAPRLEKGSDRVASIVCEVAKLQCSLSHKALEFVVQGSAKDFSKSGIYGELDLVSNHKRIIVTPVSERLPPDEFQRIFESLDVVLLPYDILVYGSQGSGIIQDSVVAIKPIVHTKGMAMASFLMHGNAIAATSDDEFAIALIDIYSRKVDYSDGVFKAESFFNEMIKRLPEKLDLDPAL